MISAVLEGNAVLLEDGSTEALVMDAKGWEHLYCASPDRCGDGAALCTRTLPEVFGHLWLEILLRTSSVRSSSSASRVSSKELC